MGIRFSYASYLINSSVLFSFCIPTSVRTIRAKKKYTVPWSTAPHIKSKTRASRAGWASRLGSTPASTVHYIMIHEYHTVATAATTYQWHARSTHHLCGHKGRRGRWFQSCPNHRKQPGILGMCSTKLLSMAGATWLPLKARQCPQESLRVGRLHRAMR